MRKSLRTLFVAVATCLLATPVAAQQYTFSAPELGYSNSTPVTTVDGGDVKLEFSKGSGSTNPAYYTSNGESVRTYKDNTLTISSNYNITKIEMSTNYTNSTKVSYANLNIADGGGSFTTKGAKAATWEGSAASVTFKMSNQAYFNRIVVTYDNSTVVSVTPPTIDAPVVFDGTAEASISASVGTIYYTIDGSEPTAESPVYTGSIVFSATTTIKAIAVSGNLTSAVAEQTCHNKADLNLVGEGTEANPFTTGDAVNIIDAGADVVNYFTANDIYVQGTVTSASITAGSGQANIELESTNDKTSSFTFYKFYPSATNGEKWAATDQVKAGDVIVGKGKTLTLYGDTTYELSFGQIVSINGVSTKVSDVLLKNGKTGTTYNLGGQRVGKHYNGIVIINGHKYLKK